MLEVGSLALLLHYVMMLKNIAGEQIPDQVESFTGHVEIWSKKVIVELP